MLRFVWRDESGNRKCVCLYVGVPSENGSFLPCQVCYVGSNRIEVDGVYNGIFC